MTLPRACYSLLVILALPLVVLRLLWRARRQPEYLQHWGERFGCYTPLPTQAEQRGLIWIHAVSVGETNAAQTLITSLQQRYAKHRILLTHMTPTGRETGVRLFGDSIERVYLPYDYPQAMSRFLDHFKPCLGLIMETELWPNLVHLCRNRAIPLLLINARMSEKSARRYACLPDFTASILQSFAAIAARNEEDALHLKRLGAADVKVMGNLKFDITPPAGQLLLGNGFRQLFGGRPVVLAASTRAGEEEVLLDAWTAQPVGDTLLVLVPRHPQRFAEVASLVKGRGLRLQSRSEAGPVNRETQVWLGDSMGEMFAYYASCDAAFIGGSLLDYGSQNPIEGCAVGVPMLIGPSTYNFPEVAREALACGAANSIGDATGLVDAALRLLADTAARERMGAAGKAFAALHRGASERTMALIETALAQQPTPAGR